MRKGARIGTAGGSPNHGRTRPTTALPASIGNSSPRGGGFAALRDERPRWTTANKVANLQEKQQFVLRGCAIGFLGADMGELRRRLTVILAIEEREPIDWPEVERLAGELQRELPIDSTPEIIHHYLDDADIRSRDNAYGMRQRHQVRRFIDVGEYDDGVPIPWWGCALVLLAGAGFVKWLLL